MTEVASSDSLLGIALIAAVGLVVFAMGVAAGVALAIRRRSPVAGSRSEFNEPSKAPPSSTADERLRAIAQMTGGLAHEIKNPLSTIGLNTRLLSEMIADLELPPQDTGRLTRRADALGREVERLEGILTDFLEYAGDPRLDLQPTDLNELVRDVTDFFLPQAEQRGVRLRVQAEPAQLVSSVDPGHLKQAVLNLMLNAVQAIEGRPAADVSAGREAGRELIVRTAAEDEGHSIHVTDTGPGMDEATLARVFEPYFTTKAGGSGLGLPITRKLIEAMDGRFELHSESGRGTDVRLWFPAFSDSPG